MTSISKNVYIDKLCDIVNKYNNTYYRAIKMKHVTVKLSMYIEFNQENNKEGPKFKVGDNVRIRKYKNIFEKSYALNQSEEVFVIKKVKIQCRGHILLVTLTKKKLQERFKKKNCKKTNQKEFGVKKVIKTKGNKLYVKCRKSQG